MATGMTANALIAGRAVASGILVNSGWALRTTLANCSDAHSNSCPDADASDIDDPMRNVSNLLLNAFQSSLDRFDWSLGRSSRGARLGAVAVAVAWT